MTKKYVDRWDAGCDSRPLLEEADREIEHLREVLTIPNITPDTTSSALFIRTLSEHEKGQPVNAQDLINALMWRVKNQRKEIARLQEKRGSDELCPHGMPLADNTCGPCSKGKPNAHEPEVGTSFPSELTELYNAIAGYEKLSGYAPALLSAMRQLGASRDASSEKSSVERLGIIKQTPRQASVDDIEWLCEKVEQLQAGILYEVENASLAPSARIRMRTLASGTHESEKPGYHCGKLKADCDDEFCPTHGRDIR